MIRSYQGASAELKSVLTGEDNGLGTNRIESENEIQHQNIPSSMPPQSLHTPHTQSPLPPSSLERGLSGAQSDRQGTQAIIFAIYPSPLIRSLFLPLSLSPSSSPLLSFFSSFSRLFRFLFLFLLYLPFFQHTKIHAHAHS